MIRVRAGYVIPVALAVIGAAVLFSDAVRGEDDMPKIEVTFIVSDDLARKGGIVFVMPRKIDEDEFLSRYPAAGSGPILLTAELSSSVSFVHFDAPGRDYSYRFQRIENRAPLDERQIGIGGEGNIYLDEAGEPVFAELSLDHYIYGTDISLADAQGLQTATGDFTIGPDKCRRGDGVRVCVPGAEQVRSVLEQLRKQSQ